MAEENQNKPSTQSELQKAVMLFGQKNQGNLISQLSEFIPTLQFDGEKAHAYYLRGSAYDENGEHDRAIADFNRAIELSPHYAEAYTNRGVAYIAKGEHGLAIADFDHAIELNPKYITAYNNRGYSYNQKGEYDRAIADFDHAIELNPKYITAYNNRGYSYNQKGEYDRAIADFDHAIELDNKDANLYNNRGYTYNEKGEYDRAIADFNRAIELDSKYATAYNNRGYSYNQKGEYDRAIADFNRAIKLNPKYAEAYTNRGYAYHRKGENDKSLADWKTASELSPPANTQMANNLLATIEAVTDISKQISEELKLVKGFKRRERKHYLAQKGAGKWTKVLLGTLFGFYIVALVVLILFFCYGVKVKAWDILPWLPVIFLTSSPLIWAARIKNREETRNFALRENAYANRLMALLMLDKPRNKHGEELVKKFFDHHDLRGSPQLILGAEPGQKMITDNTPGQVVNHIRQGEKPKD